MAAQSLSSVVHHRKRQDAREGGETPPLPRNCERSCLGDRRFGHWMRAGIQPGFLRLSLGTRETTEDGPQGLFLGRWLKRRKSGDRSLRLQPLSRSEGDEGAVMPVCSSLRARPGRALPPIIAVILILLLCSACQAASIRGVVTDTAGAKVTGANVVLVSNGQVVASAVSTADGSFQILTGTEGRFFLVVSARSFRQLQTPDFYAGRLDSIERNLVLEPEWVRESIVVTATGTPTPQPQTSAATSVLGPLDLALRSDLVSSLRLDARHLCDPGRPAWRGDLAVRARRRL